MSHPTSYNYRSDGKLALLTKTAGCIVNIETTSCSTQFPFYGSQSMSERYQYDALGRRVVVRTATREDATADYGGCSVTLHRCDNTTKRTVWDGDQVLYETRYPTPSRTRRRGWTP